MPIQLPRPSHHILPHLTPSSSQPALHPGKAPANLSSCQKGLAGAPEISCFRRPSWDTWHLHAQLWHLRSSLLCCGYLARNQHLPGVPYVFLDDMQIYNYKPETWACKDPDKPVRFDDQDPSFSFHTFLFLSSPHHGNGGPMGSWCPGAGAGLLSAFSPCTAAGPSCPSWETVTPALFQPPLSHWSVTSTTVSARIPHIRMPWVWVLSPWPG